MDDFLAFQAITGALGRSATLDTSAAVELLTSNVSIPEAVATWVTSSLTGLDPQTTTA